MYDRILVPIDGSSTSAKGVEQAIAMAKLTGGTIKLLHAFELPPLAIGTDTALMRGEDIYNVARDAGQSMLTQAAAIVKAAGVPVEQQLLDAGGKRLSEQVSDAAHAWNASLIVVGSHGRRGVRRLLLGSDAEQILLTSTVPVLLVRDSDPQKA